MPPALRSGRALRGTLFILVEALHGRFGLTTSEAPSANMFACAGEIGFPYFLSFALAIPPFPPIPHSHFASHLRKLILSPPTKADETGSIRCTRICKLLGPYTVLPPGSRYVAGSQRLVSEAPEGVIEQQPDLLASAGIDAPLKSTPAATSKPPTQPNGHPPEEQDNYD